MVDFLFFIFYKNVNIFIEDNIMSRNITSIGKSFREKFNYTGKLSRECMGKELWNEYYKMLIKTRLASPEHKKVLAERKQQREQEKLRKQSDPLYKLHSKIKAYYTKYCNDIINVTNFELAKIDKFEDWDLHHINGEKMSVAEMKKAGLYFNRPANEFIFLKHSEHRRLHRCKDLELAYKRALEKIERAKNTIKSAEKTIEYCKKALEKS